MDPGPEPGMESSESSSYGSASPGSSSRSRKSQYYDFHHLEESYAAELSQARREGEEGTFDSGNFSEPVDTGCGHLSPAPAPPPVPLFSIGSPGLRRTSSGIEHSTLARNDIILEPTHSNPEVSATARSQRSNRPLELQVSQAANQKSDSYLHNLVGNFNTLYEQKLDEVVKKSIGGQGDRKYNIVQKQNTIMKDWVRDLNEQNSVLIETVDEMEKEADEKIKLLQSKIQRSTQMVMEHMEIIQNYEKQAQELVEQRTESDREFEMLRSEAMAVEKKRKVIQQKLSALEIDHGSLIALMTRIRDWGLWDITGLDLDPRTNYHLFGLYPNLPGSEVQTVFTQERAREVLETECKLVELKAEYEKLLKVRNESIHELRDKESHISNLYAEKDELHRKIDNVNTEKEEIKRKLEDTQDLLAQTVMAANAAPQIDLTAHDAEMSELLTELRSLKHELNVACTERQTAMMEASSLKTEMSERLLEMTQMKNLLVNIQAETESTRGKVQDVQNRQDQLSILQDQVKMYQEKYEDARAMLSSKADMMGNLQQQMDQLHEKVSKIELVKPTPELPVPLVPTPTMVIHPPVLPPRRPAEEKLRSLRKKPEALRAAAKGLDAASRAMKELERQKDEDINSTDPIKSIHGSSFSGEKPPWNEYFYSNNTNNTFLKELEAFTAEATTAINYAEDKQHHEKNKSLLPFGMTKQFDGQRADEHAEKKPRKALGEQHYQHATKLVPIEEKQILEKKTRPLSVRYPQRSPPDHVTVTDPQTPRARSRSMDLRKKTELSQTSRRSQSKTGNIVESKVSKSILRKPESVMLPIGKTSKQSLKSARHEKITKYFSDRFGIRIEDPKTTKSLLTTAKVQEKELPYVKERIKFAPYVSTKASGDQHGRNRGNTDKRVEFNLPSITERREKELKSSRRSSTKYDEYQGSNGHRPVSRQTNIREISSNMPEDDSCDDSEFDILPRFTNSRPTTREEKLSSLPSGGQAYTPSTDPYELKKLEALVHAAVNTSKQLISTFDPSQGSVRMRVTASHRRHVQSKHSKSYRPSPERSLSPEKQYSLDVDEDDDDSSELPTNDTPQNETSEEEIKIDTSPQAIKNLRRRTEELAQPYDPLKSIPFPRPDPVASRRNHEDILAALPVQNQDHVVKNWIMKSGFNRPEPEPSSTGASVGQKTHLHSFSSHGKKSSLRRVSNKSHRAPMGTLPAGKDISNSNLTPRDMFPKAYDVNLHKMSRTIDHWVSTKNEDSASETDSSFDKTLGQGQGDHWAHNNNTVPKLTSTPRPEEEKNSVTNELLEKLNARIISLESQCKSKDTLLQSLETELNVEKDYKTRIQAEMASREAEVTMQKATSVDYTTSSNLSNEPLTGQSELKEKNVLLYQCYALLSKIEPDYIQENLESDIDEKYLLPTSNGCKSLSSFTDSDVEHLIKLLEGSKLEAILTTIIRENKDLKQRLNEEIKKVGSLQNELNAKEKSPIQPSAMFTQFHSLISSLEGENNKFKAELNELAADSKSSKYSPLSMRNVDDKVKQDEMIRIQSQQITNFEEYINRLHDEIKEWTNLTTNQSIGSDFDNGSIIAHLQENIRHYEEFSKAKTDQHLKLMSTMKKIKDDLKISRKRELELDRENKMLQKTILSLNDHMVDLVKSSEDMQYKFESMSMSMSRWGSMDLSNISDNALMTSTPRAKYGVQMPDPDKPTDYVSATANLDIPDLNSTDSRPTTDLKQPSIPCILDGGGQGDNP